MRIASLVGATALMTVAASAAYADAITSRVVAWHPEKKTMIFADKSQIEIDPKLVPAEVKAGSIITIVYTGSENGVEKINQIKVQN